jgi:hypothetical protein
VVTQKAKEHFYLASTPRKESSAVATLLTKKAMNSSYFFRLEVEKNLTLRASQSREAAGREKSSCFALCFSVSDGMHTNRCEFTYRTRIIDTSWRHLPYSDPAIKEFILHLNKEKNFRLVVANSRATSDSLLAMLTICIRLFYAHLYSDTCVGRQASISTAVGERLFAGAPGQTP